MTVYTCRNNTMNTTAAMSMEASFACANAAACTASANRANSIAARLDTIAMVSIFVILVLSLSIILVSLLGLSILLVCLLSLLVLVYCHIPSKEQPQPK